MSTNSNTSQVQLVQQLFRYEAFTKDAVRKVLLSVDRADFTKRFPYDDFPQPIGHNATISAPHMHAAALENLCDIIKEDSKILDVGSGSGYLTACFAKMIGTKGKVIGIDHIEELVNDSIMNVRKHNADLLDSGKLEIRVGDGRIGCPSDAPFDAIHVGAAPVELPQTLIEQLTIGGRMLIPVGPAGNQEFLQIDKTTATTYKKTTIIPVNYVPLTSKNHQLGH